MTTPRPGWVVALLALAASLSGLWNGFVYDDVPIILQNPVIRQVFDLERIWTAPYWAAGWLYRPVTVQLFAIEWALGEGRRMAFHGVSIALMVLVAVLFWRLARRILPPLPALIAAALFAVHPVHVESVGNIVGQAELLAAALVLVAVERYLAWRATGRITGGQRVLLAGITLAAIFSKETGVVIPALLLAAELGIVGGAARWKERLSGIAPTLLLQGAAVAVAVLIRIIVLGPTTGAGPSVALAGLAPFDRIAGMLAVVPEWFRLLLWPAHLQAEYGPPAVAVTGPFGVAHALGLALLTGAAGLAWAMRRRGPVIVFGIGWVALTLFLPSAGAMLALGGIAALLWPRLEAARPGYRTLTFVLLALVVGAGAVRSAERQLAWKDQAGFIRRLELDAPTTYRAQLVASNYYAETGRDAPAERAGARAYALFKDDPQVYEQYGQSLRRQGRCLEAIPVLDAGMQRFPDRTIVRSRLIECVLKAGDSARALRVADEAVRRGHTEFEATVRRLRGVR